MSTATAVAQRSPAGGASTSPGYQGSSPPATKPTERPANAEMERQAAPASEPAAGKEVESNPDVAVEGDANAAANKACKDEDATPAKEVRKKRISCIHCCLLLFFVAKVLFGCCAQETRSRSDTTAMDRQDIWTCGWLQMAGAACIYRPGWLRHMAAPDTPADRRTARVRLDRLFKWAVAADWRGRTNLECWYIFGLRVPHTALTICDSR